MDELISRNALLAEFEKQADKCEDFHISAIETEIECAPAVALVRHGRWVQVICHVEYEDGFVDRLYECCSLCHMPNGRETTDYCPYCGAKMDGEGGE